MSANTRLDSLHDLIRHNANLQITCLCGRQHIYDASRLCRYAMCRGWNEHLEALGYHLRCSACGKRGPHLKAVMQPPTPADPFPRSERDWKALIRRLRG